MYKQIIKSVTSFHIDLYIHLHFNKANTNVVFLNSSYSSMASHITMDAQEWLQSIL